MDYDKLHAITADWGDDPYGDAIATIKALLEAALESDAMSDAEHDNLVAIEEFIRMRDNA